MTLSDVLLGVLSTATLHRRTSYEWRLPPLVPLPDPPGQCLSIKLSLPSTAFQLKDHHLLEIVQVIQDMLQAQLAWTPV